MPLNILRLNHAPSSHPNDRIAFVKPLPRPPHLHADYTHADLFLRAIAAQCLPIMKAHHLSVTTLEEHEPNREFIGRNFNNGEVVQLVLRRRGGDGGGGGEGWMSFRQVQMVMMHELAHNVQMNHGRGFWAQRNQFAAEMGVLWGKGYTGEGFWGVGRGLEGLERHAGSAVEVGVGREVEGLCGGTFRSRGRKRKRKREGGDQEGDEEPRTRKLTWKEQRDQRVEKKFGRNGTALGEDEDARIKLEIRKKGPLGGRPRVAGSKRGRELRAAAALARFEVQKDEVQVKHEEDVNSENNSEEDELAAGTAKPAIDINGNRLLDSMGSGMVKVCGDEDADDANVKQEMEDFDSLESQSSSRREKAPQPMYPAAGLSKPPDSPAEATTPSASVQAGPEPKALYSIPQHRRSPTPPPSRSSPVQSRASRTAGRPTTGTTTTTPASQPPSSHSASPTNTTPNPTSDPTPTATATTHRYTCPICSTPNPPLSPTCTTCAHVLDRRKDPRAWRCARDACQGSEYVNAGDCARCGGCGERR